MRIAYSELGALEETPSQRAATGTAHTRSLRRAEIGPVWKGHRSGTDRRGDLGGTSGRGRRVG